MAIIRVISSRYLEQEMSFTLASLDSEVSVKVIEKQNLLNLISNRFEKSLAFEFWLASLIREIQFNHISLYRHYPDFEMAGITLSAMMYGYPTRFTLFRYWENRLQTKLPSTLFGKL